ncbi:MAG: LysM peptidoglycan-binding domain-containing protein [Anaerolineales bacterium]
MKHITLLTATILTLLLLASVTLTARAAGQQQGSGFVTPTPGPDGRIIYIVQEGDNCNLIAQRTGITFKQLLALNANLDANCLIIPGQTLVIGTGGPGGGSTPTSNGPAATATPGPPTPTSIPGSIDVCVLLYDDQNGDALHQDAEPAIENGAVSISGTSGQYSQTATTQAGTDPICFTKVPVGTYTISVAAPAGYNATTLLNYNLEVKQGDVKTGEIKAGDRVYVDFGAQKSSQASTAGNGSANGGDDNMLLGIVGGVLLLVGGGLGIYAWRMYGRKPTMLG